VSEIVFRGTVTSFLDSGSGYRIAVFRVSRVWKGKVKETFEMPALQEISACMGFLPKLEIGSELIVYAHRPVPSNPELFPIVCNTLLVRDVKDIAELGAGKKPSSK
jgi:hypothetical protein